MSLVVLLLISLHLHLWWDGRGGIGREDLEVSASDSAPRPIQLEEATLRSLVRDEVARGIGATGLTERDLEALSRAIEQSVREGLAGAQIRATIAEEYVLGYYDALAEIERIEAARGEAE